MFFFCLVFAMSLLLPLWILKLFFVLLCVTLCPSSFAIILMRKRELVTLLCLLLKQFKPLQ